MQKVLITGGSGLLGKYLYLTKPNSVELSSTWYTNHAEHVQYHLNISNKSQLAYILDLVKPDVIIHCAAVGSVDYAEQAYREVRQVNVGGIENLLWAISNTSIKLVYISTNAVYDGINPPYNENSIRHPANVYGRIKLDAENKVMHSNLSNNWLIIRPFLMFGWPNIGGRNNWANTIINKLKNKEDIKLVNDTFWQPTYAGDMAKAIWKLALDPSFHDESFNLAVDDHMVLHEFGLLVAETFGLDSKLIEPVSSDYFSSIAKRPKDTRYDLAKAKKFGIEFSAKEGLEQMKEEKE